MSVGVRDRSLQLPYADEAQFWPNIVQTLVSDHLGLAFWMVAYGRFDCVEEMCLSCFKFSIHVNSWRHETGWGDIITLFSNFCEEENAEKWLHLPASRAAKAELGKRNKYDCQVQILSTKSYKCEWLWESLRIVKKYLKSQTLLLLLFNRKSGCYFLRVSSYLRSGVLLYA